MDANGLNFRMLSTASDWLPPAGSDVLYYCAESQRLQLRSRRTGNPPVEDFTTASNLVETAPMCRDLFGNYARWDSAGKQVVAGGSGTGEVAIYTPATGQTVTDMVMGYDGVLYLAVTGTLVLVDRRNRWPNFTLSVSDFNFWRLTALPDGGVMALDRANSQLGTVAGLPLQIEPSDTPDSGILRSCQGNAKPPQIVARYALPRTETFVAFTAMAPGRFCLLSWAVAGASNQKAFLRLYQPSSGVSNAWTLLETVFPYSITWLDNQRLAVLATNLNEALIVDLQGAAAALSPAGDSYILSGKNVGPFVHGFDSPTYYSAGAAMFPLLPLSLNSLASNGETDPAVPNVLDSGSAQTTWHRIFLEAILPPRCGVLIWLAATNNRADLIAGAATPATWYPLVFGAVDRPVSADTPRATWVPIASEVPFAQPLLQGSPPLKDRQGLFMILAQRAGTAVRSLTGRYLGIRIRLNGDRRSTPEIAALRVYSSRFSYVNHYLPELYRENKYGSDADTPGASSQRDFFERFVNIFEAQLTRIEDRIANSYLLTRPEAAPDESLDWLGGWIGLDPTGYPPGRRRARLLAAPQLYKARGTVSGITQALDVATNGMCSRGAILVLEDFRMRHIFATILGADLAINNDPLLPGHSGSSNSFVGDTLFLGDARNPDFLALFATSVELPQEQQQVQQFLDSLAHRITIFIHNQVEMVDVNLVRQIVEEEKPAHVAAAIRLATQPLMIGLASLLGVNSYMAPEPPPDPATVDVSRLGRYDVIQHVPSLDPRWENGEANVI